MTLSNEKIFSEALALPPDVRALLAEKLLKSLDPKADEEIDRLWAEEAERRVEQIRSGDVKPLPGEEVLREIRETFFS